ncbi:MAG: hypothetical protein GTO02_11520 [Candidatus Dadabacteria bacterium]|nr:hypothetical protein [Candidatus Dadabacteria bacterium]NIQ14985.1 hypothetical protein [Candidatus Dadabacteria bacterium]
MNNNGFTIIELLITTTILTFVVAVMTLSLLQQQRQFNLTREASDIEQTSRIALDLIATEIRNASSRQGKFYAIDFINGGGSNCSAANGATSSGSKDAPPDCVTIRTWDITRGQGEGVSSLFSNTDNLPSIATPPTLLLKDSSKIELSLPPEWFQSNGKFIGRNPSASSVEVLLGLRSRTKICPDPDSRCGSNPANCTNCAAEPNKCSECSVLLLADIDEANKKAVINSLSDIKAHNLPSNYTQFSHFIDGLDVTISNNTVKYGLLPSIINNPSEMTIVTEKTFRIDANTRELELSVNGGNFQPIVGGLDAPGIVDIQFIFTLQDDDGRTIKVGIPTNTQNNLFHDFNVNDLLDKGKGVKDIRQVEIFVVTKSKIRPQKIRGSFYDQSIPAIADVAERTVASPSSSSFAPPEPEQGFIYRLFNTTVYPRNLAREDFG